MGITIENFGKICRLCLSEKTCLDTLFQDNFIEKLKAFTSLVIFENDGLPKFICKLCMCQINTTFEFKQLCEASDFEIKQFLLQQNVKQEPVTDEDLDIEETIISGQNRHNFQAERRSEHFTYKETISKVENNGAHPAHRQTFYEGTSDFFSHRPDNSRDELVKYQRKRYCCVFCRKLVAKLANHLKAIHKSEKEVIDFLRYPPKSRERSNIIANIRKRGSFYYNVNIGNMNNIVLPQKPDTPTNQPNELHPCTTCLGYFTKDILVSHNKNCQVKLNDFSSGNDNKLVTTKQSGQVLLKYILPLMKQDGITQEAKADSLILSYGAELCNRHNLKRRPLRLIVIQKIRHLSRVVLHLKKLNTDIQQLMDALDVKFVDTFLAAIETASDDIVQSGKYIKHTLLQDLATIIRKCANIVIANAVIKEDKGLKTKVEAFVTGFESSFEEKLKTVVVKKEDLEDKKNEESPPEINEEKNSEEKVEENTDKNTEEPMASEETSGNIDETDNSTTDTTQNRKRIRDDEGSDVLSGDEEDQELNRIYEEERMIIDSDGETGEVITPKRRILRRQWRTPERCAVTKHFFEMIQTGSLPSRQEVEKCKTEEPNLKNRTWQQIKAWISNQHRILRETKDVDT